MSHLFDPLGSCCTRLFKYEMSQDDKRLCPVPNCPTIQFNHIKCLVPNCPGAKLSGAKLSWCQIVLVPNCPLLLSWCQIVRFYYLGAKLSALLSWCQIVRCQIVRCQIVRCQIVLQSALPAVGRLWPSRRKISTYEVLSKWCGR